MKILNCIHVTSTEKKHLKAFLNSGLQNAKINTKIYSILSVKNKDQKTIYKIKISTPFKNDIGQKKYDHQTIELIN